MLLCILSWTQYTFFLIPALSLIIMIYILCEISNQLFGKVMFRRSERNYKYTLLHKEHLLNFNIVVHVMKNFVWRKWNYRIYCHKHVATFCLTYFENLTFHICKWKTVQIASGPFYQYSCPSVLLNYSSFVIKWLGFILTVLCDISAC